VPLIEVSAGTPAIPQGTYLASVVGIAPKTMTTKYSKPGTEDDFLEWTWLVDHDGGTELRSLTTTATGPKSRIFEYLVALLGAANVDIGMGFDEADLVGKQAQLSIIVDENGFSKVDRVVAPLRAAAPAPAKAQPAKAAPTEAPADEATEDDLPF
jgi:hypothetical protein